MKKITLSVLALGVAFASPVLANEATHNGASVVKPAIEIATRSPAVPAGFSATTQSALSSGFTVFASRPGAVASVDPARGASSGR